MLVVAVAPRAPPGLEQHAPGHRGLAHVGAELLDADARGGEGARDLGHDARVVGPEQLEVQSQRLVLDRQVGLLERRPAEPMSFSAVRSATSASAWSSATATIRMPANLPASRAIWLRSQLAPWALIGAERADTSPGRSSPMHGEGEGGHGRRLRDPGGIALRPDSADSVGRGQPEARPDDARGVARGREGRRQGARCSPAGAVTRRARCAVTRGRPGPGRWRRSGPRRPLRPGGSHPAGGRWAPPGSASGLRARH